MSGSIGDRPIDPPGMQGPLNADSKIADPAVAKFLKGLSQAEPLPQLELAPTKGLLEAKMDKVSEAIDKMKSTPLPDAGPMELKPQKGISPKEFEKMRLAAGGRPDPLIAEAQLASQAALEKTLAYKFMTFINQFR